jgi:hypothetical protein
MWSPGIEGNDLDIDLFAFVGIELRYVCRDVEHGVHFVRIVVAVCSASLCFSAAIADPQASGTTKSAAIGVRSIVDGSQIT